MTTTQEAVAEKLGHLERALAVFRATVSTRTLDTGELRVWNRSHQAYGETLACEEYGEDGERHWRYVTRTQDRAVPLVYPADDVQAASDAAEAAFWVVDAVSPQSYRLMATGELVMVPSQLDRALELTRAGYEEAMRTHGLLDDAIRVISASAQSRITAAIRDGREQAPSGVG